MCYSKIRNLVLLLSVTVLIIGITGCEKDGAIKIINRTSFPVYAGVGSDNIIIQGGQSKSIDISTSTSSIFNPDVEKKVLLHLIGETFRIYDDYTETYVDSTTTFVRPGETTKVYVDPNLASVKVINQSDSTITRVLVERHELQNTYFNGFDVSLGPGDQWFRPIPPATVNNQFYLIVKITFSGATIYQYGDVETIIGKDQQFLITVLPAD